MKRFHNSNEEMQISEAELAGMTSDLADAHSDTLPAMRSSIEAWGLQRDDDAEVTVGLSRRSFLTRTGLFAAGGLLVASGGVAAASTIPRIAGSSSGDLASFSGSSAPLDVRVSALAASLENLAVATYGAALSAATAGKLGTVPKAIATFVETAMAQHKDHAAAWNAVIVGAGYKKITAPNAAIGKTVDAAFAKVTNIPGVAKLALTLEEAAAATYLEAIGVVSGRAAIETAATIHPVEMQHAAILNFVLGKYPVPASFGQTSAAAPLSVGPKVKRK